ncbi:helix-turn-helix transcriptional regulator [Micromonospora sp. NPDC006766]|uniref:helix-turn-helix domain-containing protein n=1 Tax=Micromonospora sp. NPDC006766 TaxID=3154778 RepID=UPI0033E0DD39
MSDPLRSALRLRLGAQLRVIRRYRGLSGAALAERITVSQSKVSRIESGTLWPPLADIIAWLDACYVDQATRSRVMSLAEAIEQRVTTLRDLHRGSLEVRQLELVGLDGRAARVRHFQPLIVPGLFQTAEYARATITAANLHGERDVTAAVEARMRRVARMRQPGAPAYHAVLTEAALRWRPAGDVDLRPDVWRSILDTASVDSITVQVIPIGTPMTAVPTCGFTAYEFADDDPLVIVEATAAEITFAGEAETADFGIVFDRMAVAALSPDDSLGFIAQLLT